MAITTIDYAVFEMLHAERIVPPRPTLLELGEAEWFGDVALLRLSESIEERVADVEQRDALQQRLATLIAARPPTLGWDLAKIFYGVFLGCRHIVSIDLHGSAEARRIDLNERVDLGEQFDVVFNSGTAEHIFNVGQFFKTVHEVTRPGGLMLHVAPFQGWLEHGFYSFNPGLFWDLAASNGYSVLQLAYTQTEPAKIVALGSREHIVRMHRAGELAPDSLLYAVLRKSGSESAFRFPMQAGYVGGLSDEMIHAWKTLRRSPSA